MVGFTPRASAFLLVSQPRRFVAQNDKEIEGLGCLPGICSEFARNSLGIRNLLGIHSENGLNQPCADSPDCLHFEIMEVCCDSIGARKGGCGCFFRACLMLCWHVPAHGLLH